MFHRNFRLSLVDRKREIKAHDKEHIHKDRFETLYSYAIYYYRIGFLSCHLIFFLSCYIVILLSDYLSVECDGSPMLYNSVPHVPKPQTPNLGDVLLLCAIPSPPICLCHAVASCTWGSAANRSNTHGMVARCADHRCSHWPAEQAVLTCKLRCCCCSIP